MLTDWNIFGVTLIVGILSTLATIIAVWRTNKKTTERYNKTREDERKQNALVIIKPVLKLTTFWSILDSLILKDVWDRGFTVVKG